MARAAEPIHHIETYHKSRSDRATRRMCRQYGAAILDAMSRQDMSLANMARRLDVPERSLRREFNKLVDGRYVQLSMIALMAFALGCRVHITLREDPDA